MVSINERQIHNIANNITSISVKKIHLERGFLSCEGRIESKLIAYMICSAICHQTHNLIRTDENLIGWQYIEYVFTNLIKEGDKLLDFNYLMQHSIEEIALYLERLFPKSNTENVTTLDNSIDRASLLKDTVLTLDENNFNSLYEFFIKYSENKVIDVKRVYSELENFKAFSDPYKKKSTLLLKLITQSGLFELEKNESLEPMMDYHMQRLLLRTGCLIIDDQDLEKKLKGRITMVSDDMIRKTCIEAIKEISLFSNKTIFDLDDIFWSIGRSCCKDKILCVDGVCNKTPCTFTQLTNIKEHSLCIFESCCLGKVDVKLREYWEPNVQTEFY